MSTIRAFSLSLILGFTATLARGELVIVPQLDYVLPGTWGIDADGDGIFDLGPPTSASRVQYFADILEFPSTVSFETFVNASAHEVPETYNGSYSAPPSIILQPGAGVKDNASHTDPLNPIPRALLFHGSATITETSLSNSVSLVGAYIEPPTAGIAGARSNQVHDDSFYVYFHNFGRIPQGTSVILNYTDGVFSVPEPSTAVLALVSFSAVVSRRSRKGTMSGARR